MSQVEKATPDMFEEVYPLLLKFNNQKLTKDDWKRLFHNPWQSEDEFPGFVLVDQGSIKGFMSTIFATREINGKTEKFCNLSSWIVDDEYRNDSLKILLPVLKLRDYTLTNITPLPHVSQIHQRLGFVFLDNSFYVLPNAGLSVLGRYDTTLDVNEIRPYLADHDRKILSDHASLKCRHFLITSGSDSCYLVFTERKKSGLPVTHLHYISNLGYFLNNFGRIGLSLFRKTGIPFSIVDPRILKGNTIRFSYEMKLKADKIFKSNTLKKEDIDNLYTELVLLNL